MDGYLHVADKRINRIEETVFKSTDRAGQQFSGEKIQAKLSDIHQGVFDIGRKIYDIRLLFGRLNEQMHNETREAEIESEIKQLDDSVRSLVG